MNNEKEDPVLEEIVLTGEIMYIGTGALAVQYRRTESNTGRQPRTSMKLFSSSVLFE